MGYNWTGGHSARFASGASQVICLFAKLPTAVGKVLAMLRLYATRTCTLPPTTLPRFRLSGNEAGSRDMAVLFGWAFHDFDFLRRQAVERIH